MYQFQYQNQTSLALKQLKITKRYDEIRREKAKKLARVKGKEIIEKEHKKKYTKSAGITAKKKKVISIKK